MNINGRLAFAMILAITTSLISTSAKAQSIQEQNLTQIDHGSVIQQNPQLMRKIRIIQPGGVYGGKPGDFHDAHPNLPKFGEAKPGTPFVNFKKPDTEFERINPAYKIRPSAVEQFNNIQKY
ncbi:hypothetical protein NIES4101_62830 [Calothrix sp. NIES-4101]|nr:hypothetical protein NIES4101_62830 [Calothrix sp. NIES-4101]